MLEAPPAQEGSSKRSTVGMTRFAQFAICCVLSGAATARPPNKPRRSCKTNQTILTCRSRGCENGLARIKFVNEVQQLAALTHWVHWCDLGDCDLSERFV